MFKSRLLDILLPAGFFTFVFFTFPSLAREPAPGTLAGVIESCDSCHAVDARVRSIAPVLDGLPRRYLEDQMLNFTSGKRGADPTGHFVQLMTSQLLALDSSQSKQLARHYARRKLIISRETVAGNANAGELLFEEYCSGCHTSTIGRLVTGSPPISHLEGQYILSQLQAFAIGHRNFAKDGRHKTRMAEVAGQLSPQEMLDITAFIKARFAVPKL